MHTLEHFPFRIIASPAPLSFSSQNYSETPLVGQCPSQLLNNRNVWFPSHTIQFLKATTPAWTHSWKPRSCEVRSKVSSRKHCLDRRSYRWRSRRQSRRSGWRAHSFMRHNCASMSSKIRQLAWSTPSMRLKECWQSKRNASLGWIAVSTEKRVPCVLKNIS